MMEKSDLVKFGKYKGKTWGELLEFEAGQGWLRWWAETPSTGKFANYENKQKALIKEWLGEPKKDTRAGSQIVNMAFVLNKLEIIEKLLNALLKKGGMTTEWQEEDTTTGDRVQWEE